MRFDLENRKKTGFEKDTEFEKIVQEWLESHDGFDPLEVEEMVEDKERQLAGIDIISKKYGNIDAKVVATKIPTFCFEVMGNIHSKQKGTESGWLFKKDSKTKYYLLEYCGVKKSTHDIPTDKQLVISQKGANIQDCEMYMLDRSEIQKTVMGYFDLNMDETEVFEQIRKYKSNGGTQYFTIRNRKVVPLPYRDKEKEALWLSVSGLHREVPVNVVIRKGILERMAKESWVVQDSISA